LRSYRVGLLKTSRRERQQSDRKQETRKTTQIFPLFKSIKNLSYLHIYLKIWNSLLHLNTSKQNDHQVIPVSCFHLITNLLKNFPNSNFLFSNILKSYIKNKLYFKFFIPILIGTSCVDIYFFFSNKNTLFYLKSII